MGDDGADQHQRHHAERDYLFGIVDLVDEEVIAGLNRLTSV